MSELHLFDVFRTCLQLVKLTVVSPPRPAAAAAAAASLASAADDRARPEERRRNELYRQYYEELQRRSDSERPVDCSVIVVNKAQKYVRSLGRRGERATSPRVGAAHAVFLFHIALCLSLSLSLSVCVCVCVSLCVHVLHKHLSGVC